MLDFLEIGIGYDQKNKTQTIYPDFKVIRSNDIMVSDGKFVAIWDADNNVWSKDEYRAIDIIDELLLKKLNEMHDPERYKVMYLRDASNGYINKWKALVEKQLPDNFKYLDRDITYFDTKTKRGDYRSMRLDYSLEEGEPEAWNTLTNVLYATDDKHKLEWMIGSVVAGKSKKIQKAAVLYGDSGTGKSTVLNVIQEMFKGYWASFSAEKMGSASASFALEPLKDNPILGIEHDSNLSTINSNILLNSVISHEQVPLNAKHKAIRGIKLDTILFMGSNEPVKITNSKSGLKRRILDIYPTGKRVDGRSYNRLMKQIENEYGKIANHCKNVFLEDPHFYDKYIAVNMEQETNEFADYILESLSFYDNEEGFVSLKDAYKHYRLRAEEDGFKPVNKMIFKRELKSYFEERKNDIFYEGKHYTNVYVGFKKDRIYGKTYESTVNVIDIPTEESWIKFEEGTESILDETLKNYPACYNDAEKDKPSVAWAYCKTCLKDLDTSKLHWVRTPLTLICIDFDIPDSKGKKNFKLNLEAASKWPKTYAETSKSGEGIHLHYWYSGDPTTLASSVDEHIEIKVYSGKQALRRMLTKHTQNPIATLPAGYLPKKEAKKLISKEALHNEQVLKLTIAKALRKEIDKCEHTAPAMSFIKKITDEAYAAGYSYDITNFRKSIMTFASNSTNQANECLKIAKSLHYTSKDIEEQIEHIGDDTLPDDYMSRPYAVYDCEVFPNVFFVNYCLVTDEQLAELRSLIEIDIHGDPKYGKVIEELKKYPTVRLVNPTPKDMIVLMNYRMVGFNNLRYDNDMIYARTTGTDEYGLYCLSKSIVSNDNSAHNYLARGLSYMDLYDIAADKMSLKKWEIKLDFHHQELGMDWNQPVPEDKWNEVAEYCDNDVIATLLLMVHLDGDIKAREILVDICKAKGLKATMMTRTNALTTMIIFGSEKHPALNCPDLAEEFPGYEYDQGKNMYHGIDVGRGGYVFSKPGIYHNIALLDIQSMHPTSAIVMEAFGEYTKNYKDIYDARVAIKHKDFDTAKKLMDGVLAPYLDDPKSAKQLAQALKIAINSVYGLTSASFDNPFRDPRNVNNIVALRGALFMVHLQELVEEKGYTVAHIKTDSIKIPDADEKIIDFCMKEAEKYGYKFEHEATYEKMCLIDKAQYIAKYSMDDFNEHPGEWTATGKAFQVPFIFKTLFSEEPIEFEDLCLTFEVKTALYIDIPGVGLSFVGKVGELCPMKDGTPGAGPLLRESTDREGNIKYDSATGSKGYIWMESEKVLELGLKDSINMEYFSTKVDEAIPNISVHGDVDKFIGR